MLNRRKSSNTIERGEFDLLSRQISKELKPTVAVAGSLQAVDVVAGYSELGAEADVGCLSRGWWGPCVSTVPSTAPPSPLCLDNYRTMPSLQCYGMHLRSTAATDSQCCQVRSCGELKHHKPHGAMSSYSAARVACSSFAITTVS